jgi:hypothetical protein
MNDFLNIELLLCCCILCEDDQIKSSEYNTKKSTDCKSKLMKRE